MRKVLLLSFLLVLSSLGRTDRELVEIRYDPTLEDVEDLLIPRTVEMATPDIWPVVGMVTSDFGWRRFRGRREFHTGVDIAAPYGSRVVATAPGYVLFAGYVRGYGNTVVIYHGYGFVTLYAHMAAVAVRRGERVAKNRVIGYVGSSGRTTGPHLHYEVIKYGIRQNPILYLP
jgi:murein DD-endopeptidase MepM/ murein hydrolase activator NlpD